MKIIHTSDWHLGKNLEGFSRMDEQEKFLDEFIEIVSERNPELVIIAGDIYDNGNPPARAENMFYKALKNISDGGKRAVLVIAGNHDNPDRLAAAAPLAYEQGIILLGTPKSKTKKGICGGFNVLDVGEGFVELEINNEKAVILTLPYPSEKRLDEILSENIEEEDRQFNYSNKINEIFTKLSTKFREDTINIVVSHLFTLGGEVSASERPIQLGGSLAVSLDCFPKGAQYVALGHLHKTQKFVYNGVPIYYSGSPIQYSKNEKNNSNCVYLVDLAPNKKAVIEEVFLKNYKPIEIWNCESIEAAIEKCSENCNREAWVYITIKTDRALLHDEIKEMKRLKKDIIEIIPQIDDCDAEDYSFESIKDKTINEWFTEFYKKEKNNLEPSKELMDLFLSIASEEVIEDNEAKKLEN